MLTSEVLPAPERPKIAVTPAASQDTRASIPKDPSPLETSISSTDLSLCQLAKPPGQDLRRRQRDESHGDR